MLGSSAAAEKRPILVNRHETSSSKVHNNRQHTLNIDSLLVSNVIQRSTFVYPPLRNNQPLGLEAVPLQ